MTIVEKAAYLKGLTEGMGLDSESREGRLWGVLNELLGDLAHGVEELQAKVEDQDEVLDDMFEQLVYLQEYALPEDKFEDDDYEDEDDEDEEDEDVLYPPSLRLYEGGEGEESGEEEEQEYDGVLYDVTCPGCGENITFDEETLDQGSIRCPNCGETLEFDLGGDGE